MQFVSDIEKDAGGKLKITVHSNASLFKAPEIKRAVQGGQAQMGEILISGYSNEDPVFGVDSVPFLATSYADAAKLWKASRKAIEDRFAKQGLMVLYSVPWPPQGIYSSKPLASIADMKGLKMRTYNPYTSRIAELAGAQPVTIQVAELAQAFATGAVNANITSGATGYDTKAWEVVKNYYDTQAWLPKNIVFVNKAAFDALDKGSQAAVLKAAAAAEERGWKVSEDKNKWYLEQLAKNGMSVSPPSAQLKADFRKIGDTMTAEWLKTAGADGQAIVSEYKK
jgi:TRAP-type C4-dicarboxylate transport system substrate-binding protein